jgi:hypothetical protein
MAFDNCHAETIAKVIGCDVHTLKGHFSSVLTKKRAEGKAALRHAQRELAKTNAGMAIFLGKNELGQSDRQDHQVKVTFAQIAKQALEAGDTGVSG